MISESIPFQGPLAAVRVGKVDDQLVIFPTLEQTAEGSLDLIVAGNLESVLMIEGFAKQMPEDEMLEAILFPRSTSSRSANCRTSWSPNWASRRPSTRVWVRTRF
jgi:polyribonucleotide nucleotidyltransferase